METFEVELFYGDNNVEYAGVTFFFDTYVEAMEFVELVKACSNCNYTIIQRYIKKTKKVKKEE